MNELDALSRVVYKYIAEHNGQTILMKNLETETAITQATLRKKIKLLIEKGFISKDGKNFSVIKEA